MKLLVILLVGVIIYCLGSAMYYMISKKRDPVKTAKALTWRVSLSLGIFCFLIIGFLMGWIVPHGV
jgi:TRAP-type C4-dicarboxylate transport system permease large subunit